MLNFTDKKIRGLSVSYYLARCNEQALSALGYSSFTEAFSCIGDILNENPNNIRNMRDEFDPLFNNGRRGWYQREMSASRKMVYDYFSSMSDIEVEKLVKTILGMYKSNDTTYFSSSFMLMDLKLLIHQTTVHYKESFVFTDVHLTDEFKSIYTDTLNTSNYEIEFYDSTAMIITPTYKNIFVPNQWFVIAAYGVGVFVELQKYKKYIEKIASYNKIKLDKYTKQLRDNYTYEDKRIFFNSADYILHDICDDTDERNKMVKYLWRFATDYSWWSGQKTVDRGDFYYSVILNMLNLVNSSQGYVGDIVNVYANNNKLKNLVRELDSFTTNLEGKTYDAEFKEETPVENSYSAICSDPSMKQPSNGKTKIVISPESIKKLGGK